MNTAESRYGPGKHREAVKVGPIADGLQTIRRGFDRIASSVLSRSGVAHPRQKGTLRESGDQQRLAFEPDASTLAETVELPLAITRQRQTRANPLGAVLFVEHPNYYYAGYNRSDGQAKK